MADFAPPTNLGVPRVNLDADGPTQVGQAWEYLRGYWNTTAPLQALNLGILTGAIGAIR